MTCVARMLFRTAGVEEHVGAVRELRVALTVGDFEAALAFYRDALGLDDSAASAERLTGAGAELLGGPVETPWRHRNVRMRAPDGMQLTLFTVLDE